MSGSGQVVGDRLDVSEVVDRDVSVKGEAVAGANRYGALEVEDDQAVVVGEDPSRMRRGRDAARQPDGSRFAAPRTVKGIDFRRGGQYAGNAGARQQRNGEGC